MYLRYSTRRKDGKEHTYWRVVRSVRRNGQVVQETVAQLGELDARGRARARALARAIMGREDQSDLFDHQPWADAVAVQLNRVRLKRGRSFGDVWLGWSLMAAVLVLGRLCEPSSELYLAESWYRRTALEDLLGLPSVGVNDDRLYRTLDRLLPHKAAIERHLVHRLGELFELEYDLLLYNVTSTYFEGLAGRNTMAKRGYSRDHRPDCKQVCIALVVTRNGMPLGYEVFDGNRVDVTTVEEIVATMEARYGLVQRIWVMDRGMMSAENITWLQQTGRRYLIGTSRSEMRKWSRQLTEEHDWTTVHEGVEVRLCTGPDGLETFLLCRSANRQKKENAMHARFGTRIEEGLGALEHRITHARSVLDRGTIERQIGRLLQRNTRAAGRYVINLIPDRSRPAGFRLAWSVHPAWDEWTRYSEGCYVLRTNITDWTPEALWQTYTQLTEAEAAFRIHKSELSLRPIWHQRSDRVQAHILVCFLAYVLWKTLEQWQRQAGLGSSPRTILDELGRIQSTDVVLPLADGSGREMRIRCVVRPDTSQSMLLDRLGLELPERLRIPRMMAKM